MASYMPPMRADVRGVDWEVDMVRFRAGRATAELLALLQDAPYHGTVIRLSNKGRSMDLGHGSVEVWLSYPEPNLRARLFTHLSGATRIG
jgi:hypothetical protein